jgi:hypothetical protein
MFVYMLNSLFFCDGVRSQKYYVSNKDVLFYNRFERTILLYITILRPENATDFIFFEYISYSF